MNNTPDNATEIANASAAIRTDATVRAVIDHMLELKRITPEQGELIFWFHGYGLMHGLTNTELSARSGISKTTISQIFSGKYIADDWTPICHRIEAFRKTSDNEVRLANAGFIATSIACTIHQVCDNALHDGMPAFIYGASQIGKTRSLLEYVRKANTSSVKYLRCRSGMTKCRLARLLGEVCHLRNLRQLSSNEIIDGVASSLNSSSLLILDEFHMMTETVSSDVSRQLVEYVREIYDLTHCGIVTAATKIGLIDLEEGPNRLLFDQFRRRGILKVSLPDVPPVKDINAFAKHFGLPIPHGDELKYLKTLIRSRGLGVFVAYLSKASAKVKQANERGGDKTLDWAFFQKLSNGFEALGNIESEY